MNTAPVKHADYVSKKYPYTTLMSWEFYKHRHAFYEIIIGVTGEAIHYINDKEYSLTRGDVILMKPNNSHNYKILDKDAYSHYDFYPAGNDVQKACSYYSASLYYSLAADAAPVKLTVDEATLEMLASGLARLNAIQLNPNLSSAANALYLTLLSTICGLVLEHRLTESNNTPPWLARLLTEMSKPESLSGDISDIVKLSGFSHGHLCKLFRDYTGTTLVDYFSRQKCDYAHTLLKNKALTITDISATLGYESLSHFIQVFKKYNGTTPKQYRKQLYLYSPNLSD